MEIQREEVTRAVDITVLIPNGALDSSNYRELVEAAEQAYQAGRRFLLIDFSRVPYMSSAGMVALNLIGKLFLGQPADKPEVGWQTMLAVKRERAQIRPSKQVKLLKPQKQVEEVLDMVGFSKLFEIYGDRDSALASFRAIDAPR
jgi:anti-anti-sigma regulatory factor